jgi:hypothetical protein
MATEIVTQAEAEIIRFLSGQPTREDVIAFHPSADVTARVYDLIDADREQGLSEVERRELDNYMYLEHLIRLMKIEARRQLEARDS